MIRRIRDKLFDYDIVGKYLEYDKHTGHYKTRYFKKYKLRRKK